MDIEVRDVGVIVEWKDLKPGDLFVQRAAGRSLLSLRVITDGEQSDLILSLAGAPIEGVNELPVRLAQLALSSGPYERLDYQVICRPRTLFQPALEVSQGSLVVDSDGPLIAYGKKQFGHTFVTFYDLATGKAREAAKGAPFYPLWDLLRVDDKGDERVLVGFG